ncbi:transcriptional regulator, GntR family [Enterococcus faecalis 13-SD-W-01]|nr:transcriptional regulator, GntR family [Enterococcus faecalis 13-SD-W-01]
MPINSYEDYILSWRPDKSKLKRPIYRSLIKLLEEDILSGKLVENTRLPSQRELADFLDLNFTTIGQAYKYGIGKGILYSQVGSGTYVAANVLDSISVFPGNVANHVIDLGLVSSFEECNSLILPTIQKIVNDPSIIGNMDYRELQGTDYQLETASNWLKTQGVLAHKNSIAIVSGEQNGLAIALATLFSPGDRIAVDRYTYSNFIELGHLFHLEIVPIPYDHEGMCPKALIKECHKKKIHGIFLMPSCNNPVGFQISEQRRETLAAIIQQESLWVIEDDMYSFLTTYQKSEIISPFQARIPQKVIYLAGMTKFICSGLRIAYLVFPETVRGKIEKALFNINVMTSPLEAEIVTEVLNSDISQKILEEKFELTKQANVLFDTIFDCQLDTDIYPYYRNLPIRSDISQVEIEQDYLTKGVQLYHSNRFTTQKQKDPFIRLSLSSNTLDLLEKGLNIVERSLSYYQR